MTCNLQREAVLYRQWYQMHCARNASVLFEKGYISAIVSQTDQVGKSVFTFITDEVYPVGKSVRQPEITWCVSVRQLRQLEHAE